MAVMRPRRADRSESEITEAEGQLTYRRIIFWVIVGVAVVAGVVSYFKYAKLLAPLLG